MKGCHVRKNPTWRNNTYFSDFSINIILLYNIFYNMITIWLVFYGICLVYNIFN